MKENEAQHGKVQSRYAFIEDGKKVRFVWYANETVEAQVEGQPSEFFSFQDLDENIQAILRQDYRSRQHQNDPDFYEED